MHTRDCIRYIRLNAVCISILLNITLYDALCVIYKSNPEGRGVRKIVKLCSRIFHMGLIKTFCTSAHIMNFTHRFPAKYPPLEHVRESSTRRLLGIQPRVPTENPPRLLSDNTKYLPPRDTYGKVSRDSVSSEYWAQDYWTEAHASCSALEIRCWVRSGAYRFWKTS